MNFLVLAHVVGQLWLAAEPGSTADLIGTYSLSAEALERGHSTCEACEPGQAKRLLCVRQEKNKLIGACTDVDQVTSVLQTGHGFTVDSGCDKGIGTTWAFTRTSASNVYRGTRVTQNGVCKDNKVGESICNCTYTVTATKSSDTIGDG